MASESRQVSRRAARGADLVPRVTVQRRSSTLVEGTLLLEPAGGPVPAASTAVLAGFAETLVLAAGASDEAGASPRRPVVTSLTVNRIADPASGILEGLARRVADSGMRQIFQVDIKAAGGNPVIAVVTAHVEAAVAEAAHTDTESREAAVRPARAAAQSAAPEGSGGTRPAAVRLRHLVDAASRVFATSGYGNASMREVATEAGMPIATMYQYVSGKEQLLLFVFETYMAEILEALDRANDTSTSPRERLRSCIGATLSLYDKYRAQIRLIHQEGRALGAENRRRVRSLARSTRRIWEGILNDGVERGEFRCTNPAITASLVPVLCSTWVLRRRALGDHTLDELRDAIVELLESGLGAGSVAAGARARRRP